MFLNALRAAVAVCLALGVTTAAEAHPHVWVKATSEVVYAPDGSVTAIKHHWTFDEMFSTFATQGMDTKKGLTREELAPLAEVNVTSLKDFDFFTAATADGKKATFKAPIDYYLDWKDSALTLHFTLPFEQAQKAKALELEMYDQTFFVDFSFAEGTPISLVGAPKDCKLSRPPPKDASGKFTETPFQAPPDGMQGTSFINRVLVTCP